MPAMPVRCTSCAACIGAACSATPSCLPLSWPAFPRWRRLDRARTAPLTRATTAPSSLGVAGPGANHAFLAAELVAFAGRCIERARNLRLHGVAVRAAGVGHVDSECSTGALHGDSGTLAFALLQRRNARGILGRIIEGLAVGAAFTDRECTRSPTLGDKARGGQ